MSIVDRKAACLIVSNAILLLMFAAAPFARGDSVNTPQRTVTTIAEGVYEIRHPDAPDTFPQGNTTVIVGDREVFVVDSCYMPSSASEDIAQIRKWTAKPVRYLLNTHWHYDHTLGNSTYRDAFPGLAVVAQTHTRELIEASNPGYLGRYPQQAEQFKKTLAAGKNPNGNPLTEGEISDLNTAIRGSEPVNAEFTKLLPRLHDLTPDLSFDRELDIDLGNREVQVKFLGRGNTAGDAIVFLPKEKIAIVGDLLDHPVPYLGGGFPADEVATLRSVAQLQPQVIVPGHGDIMHDQVYLHLVIEFLDTIVSAVDKEVFQPASNQSVEAMQKAVEKDIDLAGWRQKFAGEDKDNRDFFDDFSFSGVVKAAYYELIGK